MATGQPYYYKRSTRSWVNVVFLLCGAVLLILGLVELRFGWLGAGRDALLFMLGAGGLWSFGGAGGLLVTREWAMQIDERQLAWNDGKRRGEILIEQIKKVRVEEGDARCMFVETIDGARHKIPGDCYGNARDVGRWFRDNFGNRIEVEVIE